jgi:hypothetical protein
MHGHAFAPVFTLCYSCSVSGRIWLFPYVLWRIVTRSHALSRVIINGDSWPFFSRLSPLLMFHYTWSRFFTVGHASPHSLLFVKLVQCQVVFGCSFHIFARYHQSTLGLFSHVCLSCWCFITHGHAFSRLVTLDHLFVTLRPILYYLLSYFSARLYLVALLTLSPFVTHSHALSLVIMNGHSWPSFSRLSLLLMSSHMVTLSHGGSRLITHCHASPPFSIIC